MVNLNDIEYNREICIEHYPFLKYILPKIKEKWGLGKIWIFVVPLLKKKILLSFVETK